jgi:Plavaka transposase
MKMRVLKLILNILTPGLPLNEPNVAELQKLVSKTYWPFDNIEQWMLAKALTFPSPLSNKMIRNVAVERYCSWIMPGKGFKSVRDFRKRLDQLPAKGGEWQQSYVTRGPTAPQWSPPMVQFWYRDSLDVLKDIVADVRLAKDMKWAPERLVNADGERLYSELWTGDWWPRIQVHISSKLHSV